MNGFARKFTCIFSNIRLDIAASTSRFRYEKNEIISLNGNSNLIAHSFYFIALHKIIFVDCVFESDWILFLNLSKLYR